MQNRTFTRPALRFMTTPVESGGSGGEGGQNPVAGETASSDKSGAPGAEKSGDPEGAESAEEVNWRAKFEAQQKINRDLEKKMKGEFTGSEKAQMSSQLKAAERERDELQAKIDGKEKEYAAEQERRKVEADALEKANERILKAEIRASAASKLADPADALRFIDLDQFEVAEDGSVDADAITDAIEGLLKEKSYLAAQGGSERVFGSPGSHREPSKGQVTRDQLDRMTNEQINAARAEGRLDDLLGTKS